MFINISVHDQNMEEGVEVILVLASKYIYCSIIIINIMFKVLFSIFHFTQVSLVVVVVGDAELRRSWLSPKMNYKFTV